MSKEIEYIACPLCGWQRPRSFHLPSLKRKADYYELREFKFTDIDVDSILVLQTKRLGKNKGERAGKIEFLGGKTLNELPDDLREDIKLQCRKILSLL